jgi:A/G-specific adenine glycosylase
MTESTAPDPASDPAEMDAFVSRVIAAGRELYRDFAWRDTRDPYAVLVSEVMLQQTQVSRVVPYWERWMADFPDLEALAAAPLEAVLLDWQGLGYNRRAVALKRLAEEVVGAHRAAGHAGPAGLSSDPRALTALPGVGPATAAGVRAFAFDLPSAYLETNVRAVVLHELFADADGVSDRTIVPLVEAAAQRAAERDIGAREWNYALLDYGAHLKKTLPNPSRRSAHHSRQSAFEGSHRQKRARLLRAVLGGPGLSAGEYAEGWVEPDLAERILCELEEDGFVRREGDVWVIA